MPRSMMLGNGSILIGLDHYGQVRDFYFHYPGLENHVSEHFVHKIGVWVDDRSTWLDDGSWDVKVECVKDTMAAKITAVSQTHGLKLEFTDVVYNEKNIYIREITVTNDYDIRRSIKLFFNQQFNISQTHTGETAYFDPYDNVVVHYKGRRVFLINTTEDDRSFGEYSIGLFGIEGKAGTFVDAEDGVLSGNAVEHGQVDSTIGLSVELSPKASKKVYYWICVGKSLEKVKELNKEVVIRGAEKYVKSTSDYWKAWIYNQKFSFYGLGPHIVDLFNKSLVIIRTHVAKNGAIIASGDSEMLKHGRDGYQYVWHRDGAVVSKALAQAGDFNASRRFFEYCRDVISPEGYFMHKYRPDKSLGSSWHPWVRDGKKQLPIQEDETALVLDALWKYYELSKDLEFIEEVYKPLVKKPANFMCDFRDEKTGLPKPSYDLWEEKYGVSTFTSSTVYSALTVAGRIAKMLGKDESADTYLKAANEMQKAILKYLYDEKEGVFYRFLKIDGSKMEPDRTLDMSSVYGIFKYGVLPHDDLRLVKAMEIMKKRLTVDAPTGGIARYEGDQYNKRGGNIAGNPWIITTMWNTQYRIKGVTKEAEIPDIVRDFSWVVDRALPSGVLPEQVDPFTNEPLSSAPLVWSHAEYIITIVEYLQKLEEIGVCKACYPVI